MEKENSYYKTHFNSFMGGCIINNLTDKLDNLIDNYIKDNPNVNRNDVRDRAAMIIYIDGGSDSLYRDIAKCFYTNIK